MFIGGADKKAQHEVPVFALFTTSALTSLFCFAIILSGFRDSFSS